MFVASSCLCFLKPKNFYSTVLEINIVYYCKHMDWKFMCMATLCQQHSAHAMGKVNCQPVTVEAWV